MPDPQEGSLLERQRALRALIQLPAGIAVGIALGTPAQMLRPTLSYPDALDYVPGHAYRDWRNVHPRHALNVARLA